MESPKSYTWTHFTLVTPTVSRARIQCKTFFMVHNVLHLNHPPSYNVPCSSFNEYCTMCRLYYLEASYQCWALECSRCSLVQGSEISSVNYRCHSGFNWTPICFSLLIHCCVTAGLSEISNFNVASPTIYDFHSNFYNDFTRFMLLTPRYLISAHGSY